MVLLLALSQARGAFGYQFLQVLGLVVNLGHVLTGLQIHRS